MPTQAQQRRNRQGPKSKQSASRVRVNYGNNEGSGNKSKKRLKSQQSMELQSNGSSQFARISTGDPVSQALGNPLILTMIMKNLNSMDLLDKRLVSQTWNDLSTDILLKRKDFQVSFVFTSVSISDEDNGNDTNNNDVNNNEEESSSNKKSAFVLNRSKILSLDKLNQLLMKNHENPKKPFPCSSFQFKGNLKDSDAQTFLSIQGQHIKRLKLVGPSNLSQLRKLLTSQVTNLEHLSLEDWGKTSCSGLFPTPSTPQRRKKYELSSLTSFEFQDTGSRHLPLAQALLNFEITPNLQRAEVYLNYNDVDYSSIVPPNRLHLFKKPNLSLRTNDELNALEKIIFPQKSSNDNNKNNYDIDNYLELLEHIGLCAFHFDGNKDNLKRLGEIFSKILSLSQKNLTSICVNPPIELPWEIEWPTVMEKVTGLCLHVDIPQELVDRNYNATADSPFNGSPFSFFTNNNNNNCNGSKFPNLTQVQLNGDLFNEVKPYNVGFKEITSKYFPFPNDSPAVVTVKRLKIFGNCPASWMSKFSRLFPNVEHLLLLNVTDFSCYGSGIWKFSKLKIFELGLELSKENSSPAIDAIFTGMDQITCQFLQSSGQDLLNVEQINKLRVNPSILDVKDLKEVKITVNIDGRQPDDDYDDEDETGDFRENFISPVSSKYGFSMLAGLDKITLSIEPKRGFIVPGDQLYSNQVQRLKSQISNLGPFVHILPKD